MITEDKWIEKEDIAGVPSVKRGEEQMKPSWPQNAKPKLEYKEHQWRKISNYIDEIRHLQAQEQISSTSSSANAAGQEIILDDISQFPPESLSKPATQEMVWIGAGCFLLGATTFGLAYRVLYPPHHAK